MKSITELCKEHNITLEVKDPIIKDGSTVWVYTLQSFGKYQVGWVIGTIAPTLVSLLTHMDVDNLHKIMPSISNEILTVRQQIVVNNN